MTDESQDPVEANLAALLMRMTLKLPEDRRAKVVAILETQDLSQIELMGRDENDILMKIGTEVFHVPILALTQPTPGLEDHN